tara:strand:- start:5541 stop:5723 length:183 start_codon:yes stop_codon:yes gene_type:complete
MSEDFLAILIGVPLSIIVLFWYYGTSRGKKDIADLKKAKDDFKEAINDLNQKDENNSKDD